MLRHVVLSCLLAAAAASPPVVKTRAEIEEYRAALEKFKEDDTLTLEERMAANPHSSAWVNSGKYQGDIVLDDPLIEDMVNVYSTGNRNAYVVPNTRWPGGVAVYQFGNGEFNLDQQRHILYIMNVLAERTCVRFRQRTASDSNYVLITGAPNGCYAHVGYWPSRGIHVLNLARANPGQGCLNSVIVAHEWLHAFGFFHMQSTYDRYDYVRIHWENIISGQGHNFDRYNSQTVSNLGLPYEYGSCMHYGTHDFSANGRPTISTTRPYNGVLGQTVQITGFDFWRLARHYNCPGAWSAEAFEKARSYVLVSDEDGTLVEQPAELKLADELELLDEDEIED